MASVFIYTASCVAMLILGAVFGFKIYKRGFAAGVAYMTAVRLDDEFELVIPLLTLYEKLGIKAKE